MTNSYRYRGRDQRTTVDADQVEKEAYRNGTSSIDQAVSDDRLAGAVENFSPDDAGEMDVSLESWQADDLAVDTLIGATHEELLRRGQLLGDLYPFETDENTLRYIGDGFGIYEFMLCICTAPSITKGGYVRLPRLFERIVGHASASYFGPDNLCLHFGSPRTPEGPAGFADAAALLAEQTNEFIWKPNNGLDPANAGDQGVDFVFWPPLLDNRSIAQQFFLGQCACGNDWDTKFDDLNLKKLFKWFDAAVVDPVRLFATPFHIVDAVLIESSREAGFVFDRARIVGAFEKYLDKSRIANYDEEIRSLTLEVLTE